MSDELPLFNLTTERPQRKRGGRPGTANAFKYGFDSARLPVSIAADFSGANFTGLHAEIDLLRAFIDAVLERAGEACTLSERIDLLRAVTLATVTLARLPRVSPTLDQENVRSALQTALDKVLADMAAKGQVP